ncbi:MAG TPA: CDP-alcohol phosphatidyltransferase family protein [Pseudomonas sp.]|nr:CDP-alcohol phosphatidyltransferase family protein [Pseudomonas sp.]
MKTIEPRPLYIVRLNPADLLTLSGLLTSGLAILSALHGFYPLATAWLFLGMLGDALDGRLARRLKLERPFGRYLDGFMDMQIYLVAPALILYLQGFDGFWLLFLLLMMGCGCTRLAVFNDIGNIREGNELAYLGMPVFWNLFLLGAYQWLAPWLPMLLLHGLLALALVGLSHAMLWHRPFFKFKRLSHILGLCLGGFVLLTLLQWLVGVPHELFGVPHEFLGVPHA